MQNQTISEIAKVMERGLMVIPQKIRKTAGFTEGSYIRVILKNDEVILKRVANEEKKSKPSSIKITPPKYSKQQGLKILSKLTYHWTKKDDFFLAKGRKMIEERLRRYDRL